MNELNPVQIIKNLKKVLTDRYYEAKRLNEDYYACEIEEMDAKLEVLNNFNRETYRIMEELGTHLVLGMQGAIEFMRGIDEKYELEIAKVAQLEKDGFTGERYKPCGRCKGTGMTGFTHVKGGVCFRCNGIGKEKTKAYKNFLGEDDLPF